MKKKIKWTERWSAIAAIIAIPAAIFSIIAAIIGFVKLSENDKDIQKQIDNLSIIAGEAVEQTKESKTQTELLSRELEIFSQRNQILFEQLNIDKENWNKQIMPYLSMDFSNWDSGDPYSAENFSLINTGGTAKIVRLEYNKGHLNCEIEVNSKSVPKNGESKFTLLIPEGSPTSDIKIDLFIFFEDIEGNLYKQRFISKRIQQIFIQESYDYFESLKIASDPPILVEKN